MVNAKRVLIATASGLLFGFVCFGLASSGGNLPLPVAYQIIAERTLIGFAIGISALKIGHWSVHGLLMGFLISIPLAFSGLMAPDNPEYSKTSMFIMTIVIGAVYGVLIELITTKLFKAPQVSATPVIAAAAV
ncbi:MAG: hypothetical protein HY961_18040 [Ignavibacteriae bacterium]|nr:hypothetical protein [Ignavibacteriota bacterium]